MKIIKVEAAVVKAHKDDTYWGLKAWGEDYGERPSVGASLDVAYPLRWRMRHRWVPSVDTCLIRLTTDEGLVGFGESKGVIVPELVKTYIDGYLAEAILGEDPFAHRVLWDRMYSWMRGRGHIQGFHQEAAAGLDIAMWDIAGKATGRPICDLLGGRYRSNVRVYFSALAGVQDASDDAQSDRLAADTRDAVARGFTGAKIGIGFGHDADLHSVDVVRDAAGPDFLVLVDALGSYDYTQALRLTQPLADRGVGWFEAPLVPEDIDGYVNLSLRSSITIANDLAWTTALFKEILSRGGRIAVQPEVIKVGITECARIAELADIFGCSYAPHVSIGSAIQFAASVHIAAASPNFLISEYWAGENPLGDAILREPLGFEMGGLLVPDHPGLGIELDLGRLREHAVAGWATEA